MIVYINNIDEKNDDLIDYLIDHDRDFPIPISKKVNIVDYIKKIIENGKGILALHNGKIVGLVFYYDNNKIDRKAFVSLVSVDSQYRNRGIASNMVKKMIEDINNKMEYCQVPTHISNNKALDLYYSFGFKLSGLPDEDGNVMLLKEL